MKIIEEVSKDVENWKIITDDFVNKYKNKKVNWGFNGLGYIVYKRTYCRQLLNENSEEWQDTIQRCINGAQKIGAKYTKEEAQELFNLIFNLKCCFAGRMLWQLGTSTVDRFGGNSLLNCWGINIDSIKAFEFLFENLMLGGGVGFSVRREHIHELPRIKKGVIINHLNTKDADFIVPDSRSGWIRLLHAILKSFFYTGKSFTYSTILVRGYGEKINGFGGTASGPSILIEGVENIYKIFRSRENKKLRSIDVLDICNIIGSIVVAGNTRRTAELAIGDPDDYLFLRAKRWDLNSIPNWRAMSNNTICADDYSHISNDIWDGYLGNGEPYGLFNLPLCQKYGRTGEEVDEENITVLNPCQPSWAKLLTPEGIRIFSEVKIGDKIWSKEGWTTILGKFSNGFEKIYRYATQNGNFIGTKNHKIIENGKKNEIDNAIYIDTFEKTDRNIVTDKTLSSKIMFREYLGNEEVFDITVDNKSHTYWTDGCNVSNCGEVPLVNYECCNLSEIFLNNIETKEELIKCAKLLYKTQKAISLMNYIHDETNKIVHKNMKLGLGIGGICQSYDKLEWLDDCYKELKKFDKEWSKELGCGKSIKLTTVKPSGCLTKDTLISTSKGLLKLEEIGNTNGIKWQEINSLSVFTDYDFDRITKFYCNGRVETKKIITEDGNELESSLDHKYRIIDDSNKYIWREARNLTVGDRLLVKFNTHIEKTETKFKTIEYSAINSQKMIQPQYLNKDIAWFLGLFYGDGSVHNKGIRISFNRKQPNLVKWLIDFFEKEFNLKTIFGTDHDFYINSQEFKEWLKENGCLKDYAEKLELPRIIRQSSKENAIAFIDGLWRADGGIHGRYQGWTVCTISKVFSQQLLVLCRSVGFNVKISNAGPGGLGSKDRWIICNRSTNEDKKKYMKKEFRNRNYNGLWIDKIIKIENSKSETFDIEVNNSHCYLANSTVSHNTISLLSGSCPGIHPSYSKYYIRRVRIASNDPLVEICKNLNYKIEYVREFDGEEDRSTRIVEFPCFSNENTIIAKDMSAVQQLELVKKLQTIWADNAVSCTVYYKKEELNDIKEWLKHNYKKYIKSVSFLLHKDHGFKQAPYEEIDKITYDNLIKNIKPISSSIDIKNGELENLECSKGICPIK